MAIFDIRYCFTLKVVGQYGGNNDSGVLRNSPIGESFSSNLLQVPAPATVPGYRYDPLPYFLARDEIFPLQTSLMRLFPGKLSEDQHIFNYLLSRALRVIDNDFGILAIRWRIFSKPIKVSIKNTEKYTLAFIGLHNYLRSTDNPSYCPVGFVSSQTGSAEIRFGDWRNLVTKTNGAPTNIRNVRGCRNRENAVKMRDGTMPYFNGVGKVEWRMTHVRGT